MPTRRLPSRRLSARVRVLSEALEARTLFALTGPLFASDSPAGTGTISFTIAGDFTGDGNVDVIALSSTSGGALQLFPNNGDGTLSTPITLSTNVLYNATAADFNADGKLDLVSNHGTQLWLGNGDGTFSAPATVNAGGDAAGVAVGDFDGDGKADIVTGSSTRRITIIRGKGDGTFLAPITLMNNVFGTTSSLAVGDFNGDGKADVAETKTASSTYVYLGHGDGTLALPVAVPFGMSGASALKVLATDADQDGLTDLISVGYNTNGVRLSRATGNGSFATDYAIGTASPDSVAVADLNSDGRSDVVASRSILLNLGSGTFSAALPFYSPGSTAIATADFNGDGRIDIARGQAVSSVGISLGNGDGTFTPTEPPSITLPDTTYDLVSSDLNHDGNADFVTVNASTSPTIILGDGRGGGVIQPALPISGGAYTIVLKDINNDGNVDLLTGRANTPVFLGNGDGTFRSRQVLSIPSGSSRGFVVFDLDNDGKQDIIAGGVETFFRWFRGNGDGTFQAIAPVGTSASPSGGGPGLYAVDVNADGKPDLVFRNDGGGTSLCLNNGVGGFSTTAVTIASSVSGRITSGDFNGDGKVDLAVAYGQFDAFPSGAHGGFWVRFGNGDGTFGATNTTLKFFTVLGISSLSAADLNGDGKDDLIVTGFSGIHIYPGRSSNGFGAARGIASASGYSSTTVAGDFDHDGKIDLMTNVDPKALVFDKNIGIDPAAPPLLATSNYRVDENAATLTFDRPINPTTVTAGDLQITDLTTGVTSNSAASVSLSADAKTITFTLPATLTAGDYRFRLPAGAIASAAGVATATEVSLSGASIFVLPGDINHDRTVNFDDLIILAQNYNKTGQTFSQGNLDRSAGGEVNFDDLIILAQRYNVTLSAPAIAAATTVAAKKKPARTIDGLL